jgi:hypothetical protein
MEGGYSAEGIRECGLKVLQSLCRPSPSNLETLQKIEGADPSKLGALKKAIEIQRKYWDVLK